MAVFELDPTPWLPWGHELIDGGPTRLPRTYYFASQDPPPRHLDHCIALVDPPPPPGALGLWREQVRDFLVGPLQRNVVRSQPSIFGVGLYQMSSPNSVNALVQHGQYQIQNRLLRFVHVGEAPQNHRAAIGFRRGWLMFLGVHLITVMTLTLHKQWQRLDSFTHGIAMIQSLIGSWCMHLFHRRSWYLVMLFLGDLLQ
jgi:hypothetical protein